MSPARIGHWVLTLLALLAPFGALPAGLYRWVDEEGNVHYTDSIPPSQVRRGHTQLSEGGIAVKQVPPAKTKAEVREEEELNRLRAQQEHLLEQLRAEDRVLLRTFRSEDDLIMARDGKLAAIDVMIQVTRNNVRRQQEWLGGLQTQAANLERSGKPVPPHMVDTIEKTGRSIQDALDTVAAHEEQKRAIRASADRDLQRFRQLHEAAEQRKRPATRSLRSVRHYIVKCANVPSCDRLWQRASDYLHRSGLPIGNENANIVVTKQPSEASQLGVILSRISEPKEEGASVFLDLQCQTSPSGDILCRSEDAERIIEAFRVAVVQEDAASKP